MIAMIFGEHLLLAQAQAAPATGNMFVMLPVMAAIFYFMLIRPQQRKDKERKQMMEGLKTGDRVMFGGGLLGSIANMKDETLTIRIADNVKIEVSRAAVTKVLGKGDKIGDDVPA